MHALGIDVGSTNVKAVVVGPGDEVVAAASRPLRTHRDGDTVGQDADELWEGVVDAVREAANGAGSAATAIATIGVCSQYSSLVPVDATGRALAPIKLYMDTRGADRCWEVLGRHDEAFATWVERHGIPPVGGGLTLGHLLHFQIDEPDLHERTAAYLEVMDLVNLRLTGQVAATQCTMFAAQLCDNRTVGTTDYDPDLLAMAGVDASRLPPLVAIDGVHGTLLPEVAAQLGLPDGVEVRAGMNDTQAGAFATGVLDRGDDRVPPDDGDGAGGVMVGTTAVLIRAVGRHAVDLDHEVLSMPVPVPGRYVVMAENGIAGRAVEHALEVLSPTGGDAGDRFDELGAALERSAAGAGGVLFLPWLAGSMSPSADAAMRGGFLGMTLQTGRDDLLRSLAEGVARNLRWLLPAVDDLAGSATTSLRFGGGGARSEGIAQVLADVLGVRVEVLDRPELTAARAVAAVAARRHRGEDPVELRLPTASSLRPDPTAAEVHDRLQPLFESAFSANRAICQALGS